MLTFFFRDISDKLRILEEWSAWSLNKAGCLLVGYEAFRTLVFYHSYKNRGNLSSAKLEIIRDKVNKYLLQPGKYKNQQNKKILHLNQHELLVFRC